MFVDCLLVHDVDWRDAYARDGVQLVLGHWEVPLFVNFGVEKADECPFVPLGVLMVSKPECFL